MPLALRARTLWKSYAAGVAGCSARVWVLRGANLEVERGEFVAVLGARGAGTTTLLHCLAGLRRLDAGVIEAESMPLLVDSRRLNCDQVGNSRLLLIDDGLAVPRAPRDQFARVRSSDVTTLIATHELARIRDVADRVLLLHHGALSPLDRLIEVRRVAERIPPAVAIGQRQGRLP